MLRFAVPIFLGALLVFLVQPILGKIVLPWYGGISSVWITCLLFFQVALLLGYAWAHLVGRLGRAGAWLHAGLLLVSLVLLPVYPADALRPTGAEDPIPSILALLGLTIGLPFVLLSSTSPLLQHWLRGAHPDRSPYRLYALSNVGSLLALLAYPVLIETTLTSRMQAVVWSVAYACFVLLAGGCALGAALRPPEREHASPSEEGEGATWGRWWLWVGLAACGSALLLAATNQICQEVAAVPFLWIAPLAVYLLTFILCFDREHLYDRRVFGALLLLVAPGVVYALFQGLSLDARWQLLVYSVALFAGCMVCHGELVRSKPHPRYLTRFYLCIAAGGALGGILVGVVAPLVLDGFWELHIAFFAACALAVGVWIARAGDRRRRFWWALYFPMLLALGGVGVGLVLHVRDFHDEAVVATRNFYGVLRVRERYRRSLGRWRSLVHGGTKHGAQFLDETRRRDATSYFAPESGVGLAIGHHPRRDQGPLTVGVVGLGVGTIAAHMRPGDTLRFYEINPEVDRIARTWFTYLEDCPADVEVVLGDARLRMEQEVAAGEENRYDVLAVDAFNSDSIPLHLLTAECGEVYRRLVKPDGLLLLHTSNRNLDLRTVARGLAVHLGLDVARITTYRDKGRGVNHATWMILARDGHPFFRVEEVAKAIKARGPGAHQTLWTDDFASLWPLLGFE